MIKVQIKAHHLAHDRYYSGAELTLPTSKWDMLDALDKARVPYGSGEYQILHTRESPGFVQKMLGSVVYNLPDRLGPSLAEMNELAQQMAGLDGYDCEKLEGIIQIHDSYEITDAINAVCNLHRFELYPGVADDHTLGEAAIDGGGIYEPIGQIPDELLDCLDPAKVGALVRKHDGGTFTINGYVVLQDNGWDMVYDGEMLAGRPVVLEPGDPIIRMYFHNDNMHPEEEYGICLNLPASDEEVKAALDKLGTDSFDKCDWISIEGVVPDFVYTYDGASVGEYNTLAEAIKTNCSNQLAKYKAAYEMENIGDIKAAISLAERLDEYDFEPYISTAAFGRSVYAKAGMDVKLGEEYCFDFHAYGAKAMQEQNVRFMSYGFVSHPRGQEQNMAMTEQEVTEPEMLTPSGPTLTM